MCGIVGIVHADPQQPVQPSLVARMLGAIRHRGPDDEGTHIEGPVGLGMRRLSIIDLAGGRQPIYDEARSRVIVFNGEIYNYRTLRTELEARGHQFRTASDTETVVHLHEELGGAVLTVKALSELQRTGGKYALVTMCIGGGQGIAAVFERLN